MASGFIRTRYQVKLRLKQPRSCLAFVPVSKLGFFNGSANVSWRENTLDVAPTRSSRRNSSTWVGISTSSDRQCRLSRVPGLLAHRSPVTPPIGKSGGGGHATPLRQTDSHGLRPAPDGLVALRASASCVTDAELTASYEMEWGGAGVSGVALVVSAPA